MTVVLLYLQVWLPYQLSHCPAENVELKESPIVLILYNDDCEAHSNVVLALANLLKESANAQVLIDQFAFQDFSMSISLFFSNKNYFIIYTFFNYYILFIKKILSFALILGVRPNIWLLNAISEAKFILIIFSESSKRVLSGEKLIQRRPFPDLFNIAISYVIAVFIYYLFIYYFFRKLMKFHLLNQLMY